MTYAFAIWCEANTPDSLDLAAPIPPPSVPPCVGIVHHHVQCLPVLRGPRWCAARTRSFVPAGGAARNGQWAASRRWNSHLAARPSHLWSAAARRGAVATRRPSDGAFADPLVGVAPRHRSTASCGPSAVIRAAPRRPQESGWQPQLGPHHPVSSPLSSVCFF